MVLIKLLYGWRTMLPHHCGLAIVSVCGIVWRMQWFNYIHTKTTHIMRKTSSLRTWSIRILLFISIRAISIFDSILYFFIFAHQFKHICTNLRSAHIHSLIPYFGTGLVQFMNIKIVNNSNGAGGGKTESHIQSKHKMYTIPYHLYTFWIINQMQICVSSKDDEAKLKQNIIINF